MNSLVELYLHLFLNRNLNILYLVLSIMSATAEVLNFKMRKIIFNHFISLQLHNGIYVFNIIGKMRYFMQRVSSLEQDVKTTNIVS